MKKLIQYIAGAIPAITSFTVVNFALAQSDFEELPDPGGPFTLGILRDLIALVRDFVIYAGATIVIIFLVYSGILWVRAGENPKAIDKAKATFKGALYGALIIAGIRLIILTIESLATGEFFN
ncbi:MAG: hypothetical protein A2750_01025 [Candidatus Yanofskybacteria bacterium RIFCSPHIGHO2_01_FULL_45_42]|uniref:Uncharacterized protein n=3 Tax=Candidatus Yanofskyibacteriota TaxID=1752733 RepID=A0A1F8H2L0_9BACT|nr:MAG: hypothetical protein A2750_01025 [Candidatus Yanofskybacteria bacterium RIFCSPHIGHO2_01_FULL_45_42]OGN15496.1 MAG: hypothetical protein A3C81_01215 [Candidatus Yanofskybacteria bacterium RIFCSPHIGHO2_02_FULL_46_19]OGN27203.1 MAG: hypothetical protein A3B17_01125 [Candidatus Yanofskybacteria bacterium RIFCSPLOWO2_01_FULL_45_72]OGN31865.1 MAG: hypothetical protein A3J01_01760 [Candidatus Yanofskybacteria bacterium RIFCSPLOWO2_02_FULL_45_18]